MQVPQPLVAASSDLDDLPVQSPTCDPEENASEYCICCLDSEESGNILKALLGTSMQQGNRESTDRIDIIESRLVKSEMAAVQPEAVD